MRLEHYLYLSSCGPNTAVVAVSLVEKARTTKAAERGRKKNDRKRPMRRAASNATTVKA